MGKRHARGRVGNVCLTSTLAAVFAGVVLAPVVLAPVVLAPAAFADLPVGPGSFTGAPLTTSVPAEASATGTGPVSWLTTGDQKNLLRPATHTWTSAPATAANRVVVDDRVVGQVFHGAGASLTESSASLLAALPAAGRTAVMSRLFSPTTGIGLSLLRQPLGGSDFSLGSYSYDDLPAGQTDPELTRFSLAREERLVFPLVRQAVALRPGLEVVGTPWSAPAWMKTSGSLHGGTLRDEARQAYADYLVRTVAGYRAAGIPLTTLTLANEPGHETTAYPSMRLSPAQELDLAAYRLPTALDARGVASLRVLGYDHNWDDPSYPAALLQHPDGARAFAGAAFHCYAGDPSAQQTVQDVAPAHEMWMTECTGGGWSPRFDANLRWNAHTLLIGNLRNSGASLLLWNLALDPKGGPTNGGCLDCRGVVTVNPRNGAVTYNVEYYLLGQLTKAVQPGAVRIGSTDFGAGGIETVAFRNPGGSTAVVVHNNAAGARSTTVVTGTQAVTLTLAAGAVQTLLW